MSRGEGEGQTIAARFGRFVAARRWQLHMSVGAVARRSGLEVQLIAEIEGGQTNPDLVEIHKLAVALDMRPDELLRRSIEDDPPT